MSTLMSLPIRKTADERRPNTTTLLPLSGYDMAIVSFSGGKDSLAVLLHLGVPRHKIQLWHQHVDGEPGVEKDGLMDWPCTASYCRAVGAGRGDGAGSLGVQTSGHFLYVTNEPVGLVHGSTAQTPI